MRALTGETAKKRNAEISKYTIAPRLLKSLSVGLYCRMALEHVKVVYAVNTKTAHGKIHRLKQDAVGKPRDKQRALCGWAMKASVSLVYFTRQIKKGCLCRKCFPTARPNYKRAAGAGALVESIEDD